MKNVFITLAFASLMIATFSCQPAKDDLEAREEKLSKEELRAYLEDDLFSDKEIDYAIENVYEWYNDNELRDFIQFINFKNIDYAEE